MSNLIGSQGDIMLLIKNFKFSSQKKMSCKKKKFLIIKKQNYFQIFFFGLKIHFFNQYNFYISVFNLQERFVTLITTYFASIMLIMLFFDYKLSNFIIRIKYITKK